MVNSITSPRILYLKAGLFLLSGVLACVIVLIDRPSMKVGGLLVVAVWSFARAYYFVFYVIQRYVDPEFRYAGIMDALRYLFRVTRSRAR
jgi:hypothetical protein